MATPLANTQLPTCFAVKDALAAGATRAELRATGLRIPYHGVRAQERAPLLDRLTALMRQVPRRAFLAGITAAAIMGLPIPTSVGSSIPLRRPTLGVRRGQPRIRRRRVTACQLTLRPGELETREDLRITTPERTWLDLSRTMAPPDFLALTDALTAGPKALTTLSHLRSYAEQYVGTAGGKLRRQALEWADPHSESPMESIVRWHLRNLGAPPPECNTTLLLPSGAVYRPDILFREAATVVEYNGAHHDLPAQHAYDEERTRELELAGFTVFQLDRSHLARLPHHLAQIVAKVRQTPSSSPPSNVCYNR